MSVHMELPSLPPQNVEAEQAILGAVLLDNSALAKACGVLTAGDFYQIANQTIFQAMLGLSERGEAIDQIILTDHLKTQGALKSVGGAAYLAELVQAAPSSANIRYHCKIVQEKARLRQARGELVEALQAADNGAGRAELAGRVAGVQKILDSASPRITSAASPDLASALLDFGRLQTLALPNQVRHFAWLPEGGNVMVYGPRGVGKTMLQLALTAALTTGTVFLRWPVHAPVGVLYVDGEMMLVELRTRLTALLPTPPMAALHVLTSEWVYQTLKRDLVLTGEGMREGMGAILDAHPEIRVVILDNVSSLFAGLNEDKKQDWEPINAWLIRLRQRGLATVLVHHAGKGGQQRGTSGREDALDTVIRLSTPTDYEPQEGCHFELHFTKSRSVKGDEVAPLDVRLEDVGGRLVWIWKPLEKSKEEQVRDLLAEGITNTTEIAEITGVSRSYAWKLKRKIEKAVEGQAQ